MSKLVLSLAGLAMAVSPVALNALSAPENQESETLFVPNIDLEEIDLSQHKFSHIIPSLSVNLTFNQESSGPVGGSQSLPKMQIQKVEFSAVYQDTQTGEYTLADCTQLKDLRDIFLIETARNSEPVVEKFLSDQINQIDQGAKALRCPEHFGPMA